MSVDRFPHTEQPLGDASVSAGQSPCSRKESVGVFRPPFCRPDIGLSVADVCPQDAAREDVGRTLVVPVPSCVGCAMHTFESAIALGRVVALCCCHSNQIQVCEHSVPESVVRVRCDAIESDWPKLKFDVAIAPQSNFHTAYDAIAAFSSSCATACLGAVGRVGDGL